MYKENQQYKNLAVNMISEIENFCTANDKFNVCIDTLQANTRTARKIF